MAKLTAVFVEKVTETGYHVDSGCSGLYLQVTEGKNGELKKSWIFRYTSPATGKRREMGLGCLRDRSLKEARTKAGDCRKWLLEGIDPIEKKRELSLARKISHLNKLTFNEAANRYYDKYKDTWKNKKHGAQWISTIRRYVSPIIGELPVDQITTDHILRILEKDNFWSTKPETASRVQQRIATVFEWCKANKSIKGENPALWKGNLNKLLPNPSKLKSKKHHAAVHFSKINDFITRLRERNTTASLAFEFLILTAARTKEVTEATWEEVDIENRVWIIPQERMKAGHEHRVPIGKRALEIIRIMSSRKQNNFIFPGWGLKSTKGLSNNAFLNILNKMEGYTTYTAHGFRSSFRDWASETTNFPNETIELALAHTIKNKTEAAYRRMDQLDKRREVMKAWEIFIDPNQNV